VQTCALPISGRGAPRAVWPNLRASSLLPRLSRLPAYGPVSHRLQAARTHDVEAAENVRVLHANAAGAVAAHRMTGQSPARTLGNRAVVGVDVADNIARDELFE